MQKRVVIIASGETERKSLPHLLSFVAQESLLLEVRYPPGHRQLNPEIAKNLILASWFSRLDKPDKFVVLLDVDGKNPADVEAPFEGLASNLNKVTASVMVAVAQWHLEAWFFADAEKLRKYLGRDLGSVDASQPDGIQNPKEHLKNLLGKNCTYTSVVSEEIAKEVEGHEILKRSPSFAGLVSAVKNGSQSIS
jgi:phenylpyruvate tautomerase PptA (4-oxalocrotonate tautomerase family)